MDIHIFLESETRLADRLDSIKQAIFHLSERINTMSAILDSLKVAVRNNTDVISGGVTLIQGLAAKVQELIDNSTELEELRAGAQALVDEMTASDTALAAEVAANTVAAPAPEGGTEEPTT